MTPDITDASKPNKNPPRETTNARVKAYPFFAPPLIFFKLASSMISWRSHHYSKGHHKVSRMHEYT